MERVVLDEIWREGRERELSIENKRDSLGCPQAAPPAIRAPPEHTTASQAPPARRVSSADIDIKFYSI